MRIKKEFRCNHVSWKSCVGISWIFYTWDFSLSNIHHNIGFRILGFEFNCITWNLI